MPDPRVVEEDALEEAERTEEEARKRNAMRRYAANRRSHSCSDSEEEAEE